MDAVAPLALHLAQHLLTGGKLFVGYLEGQAWPEARGELELLRLNFFAIPHPLTNSVFFIVDRPWRLAKQEIRTPTGAVFYARGFLQYFDANKAEASEGWARQLQLAKHCEASHVEPDSRQAAQDYPRRDPAGAGNDEAGHRAASLRQADFPLPQ
jgi:hypothetical protein